MRRVGLLATMWFAVSLCHPASCPAQALRDVLYTSWGRLCSVSADGTGKLCLPEGLEYDDASWRPGGSTIVAERGEHDGPKSLYLLDSIGRPVRELVSSADCIRPVWSPNGRFIYALKYSVAGALLRWDSAGRHLTTIPVEGAAGAMFQMLAFSPSGKRAAILTGGFQQMDLVEVMPTTIRVVATAPSVFHYVSRAAWLDEDHIVFVGREEPGPAHLYELSTSTGAVRRIGIDSLGLADQLVLSPDRRAMVVTATLVGARPAKWQLWWYSLIGHVRRRLTDGTEGSVTGWRRLGPQPN
jgi:hypothetical protein